MGPIFSTNQYDGQTQHPWPVDFLCANARLIRCRTVSKAELWRLKIASIFLSSFLFIYISFVTFKHNFIVKYFLDDPFILSV
jgi:hypothetical protein